MESASTPLIPAKAGIQGRRRKKERKIWIPAFAGMSGTYKMVRQKKIREE
jgi:hypothetical protein